MKNIERSNVDRLPIEFQRQSESTTRDNYLESEPRHHWRSRAVFPRATQYVVCTVKGKDSVNLNLLCNSTTDRNNKFVYRIGQHWLPVASMLRNWLILGESGKLKTHRKVNKKSMRWYEHAVIVKEMKWIYWFWGESVRECVRESVRESEGGENWGECDTTTRLISQKQKPGIEVKTYGCSMYSLMKCYKWLWFWVRLIFIYVDIWILLTMMFSSIEAEVRIMSDLIWRTSFVGQLKPPQASIAILFA